MFYKINSRGVKAQKFFTKAKFNLLKKMIFLNS